MLIKSSGMLLYCVCLFPTKQSDALNYMSQIQLNFLATFVNTASKQHTNISLFGKSFSMITLSKQVDAKIDILVSKFISILPFPKTGITGAPVENTRKFSSCSFEEFSKYPNKNCLAFSSSAFSLSSKLKVFRTLVAVSLFFLSQQVAPQNDQCAASFHPKNQEFPGHYLTKTCLTNF